MPFLIEGLIMGKKKTKKSVAKRFKKTARGKILHPRPGKSHLATSKSRKRKRHLRRAKTANAADQKRISDML